MKILITGGAGFIGRWTVKKALELGHSIVVLDNLSNTSKDNIKEFMDNPNFEFIQGDVRNKSDVEKAFTSCDACMHLAAEGNVQKSIDNPDLFYDVNVKGAINILEKARETNTKVLLMGTCMEYATSNNEQGIDEIHPLMPASPYAASKIAADMLGFSYHKTYKLPIILVRPFNTYGPFQKTDSEGGVVPIFIKKHLKNEPIQIYGDGLQTRDLLYVEDCAEFLLKAIESEKAVGEFINAGTGTDVSINKLAETIETNKENIKHIKHIHPQSEIMKLLCNPAKAKQILDWEPKTSLDQGIEKTKQWLSDSND